MAKSADDPSHSPQGRSNAWAHLGGRAVQVARAALAAEPKPVEITDEMVERAAEALWRKISTYPYERLIPATVGDLRDYARVALSAALSEARTEGGEGQ